MAVEMQLYKTLFGTNEVYIFAGVQPGLAADMVNAAIMAMADACEALEAGVEGPPGYSPTVNIGTKVGGSQTITITDANGPHTYTVSDGKDGVTGWTEGTLTDGSNTLTDGVSLYSATGMTAASLTVGSGWATGHTARVGITFAASSTFSYPSAWICVGDDCSGGDFTFSQGSSYWLTIECRPDATWMFCLKVPA